MQSFRLGSISGFEIRVVVVSNERLERMVSANDITSWLRRRRDLGEEARRSPKSEVAEMKR